MDYCVWHRSQQISCKRCNTENLHRTSDTTECSNYVVDSGSIVAFREDWDILSNFFVCNVFVFGRSFRSAEAAYQWKKCNDCLRGDLANRILRAPTPKKCKQIASEIDLKALDKWHAAKGHIVVMSDVLMAKAKSNIDFRSAIIKTNDKVIVEATACMKWGCGLPPHLATTTKVYPGENLCGQLLMELRSKILREETPDQHDFNLRPYSTSMPCNIAPLSKSTSPPMMNINISRSQPEVQTLNLNDSSPTIPIGHDVANNDVMISAHKDSVNNSISKSNKHVTSRCAATSESPLCTKSVPKRLSLHFPGNLNSPDMEGNSVHNLR